MTDNYDCKIVPLCDEHNRVTGKSLDLVDSAAGPRRTSARPAARSRPRQETTPIATALFGVSVPRKSASRTWIISLSVSGRIRDRKQNNSDCLCNLTRRLASPSAPSNEFLRFNQRRDREILKHRGLEQRHSTGIAAEFRELSFHSAIARKHLRNRCDVTGLPENVAQSTHESPGGTVVNLWIDSIDIACGSLGAIGFAFKNEDPVFAFRVVRSMKSEAEFHGHVEAGHTVRRFDAGQVVDGEVGFFDQLDDRFKSALIRDCQGSVETQTKLGQPNDVCEVEIFERGVVRDVEKDGLDPLLPWHASSWR